MERPMPYALPENQLASFLERIAAHKPSRVEVLSAPMEGRPGHLAYQITGQSERDVQREIDKVVTDIDVRGGVGEFRHPARSREPEYFGRWQSRGWTRVSTAHMEAAE
jgi:hypothetical protein